MGLQIKQGSPEQLELVFTGRLDIDQVTDLWQPCRQLVAQHAPVRLIIELGGLDYCDGAGITLIKMLQTEQNRRHHTLELRNFHPKFRHLLDYLSSQQSKISARPPANGSTDGTQNSNKHIETPACPGDRKRKIISPRPAPRSIASPQQGLAEKFGYATTNMLQQLSSIVVFLGHLGYQAGCFVAHPSKIRWREFWIIFEEVAPQALPIIALIGFLIGLISTFQAAPSFANFGAQIYLVDLVALGLVREMGPLLTAVLLAGRTASAFAAELGSMKINQELEALTTMGIDPIRLLVIPRIGAVSLTMPILEIFFIFCGLLGCLVVMIILGYAPTAVWHRLCQAITPAAYLGGVLKVWVFGGVIAGVGCFHGIHTGLGAKAVGKATTQAVVNSLIMLVLVDGIFALLYYVWKI